MRTLLLSACLSFLSSILFAQVPQAIKYQAVARDSAGSIMANANITVRVSIIDSAAGGSIAYSEIHKTGTNQFGLFNISIGRGINPTGLFANINWATGSKWMQLELSQNDGATFTLIGASEMLSVPYALYAETTNTQVNSSAFNPLYPDGTDGMEGVSKVVTDSIPYVIPAGKNFYLLDQLWDDVEYTVVNGIKFSGGYIPRGNPFIILSPYDSISALSAPQNPLKIFGYLINATVATVNLNLNNGPYIVPNGKKLFVCYMAAPKDPITPKIFVNGISFYELYATMPVILNSGDTISVSPTPTNFDTYFNGYLK